VGTGNAGQYSRFQATNCLSWLSWTGWPLYTWLCSHLLHSFLFHFRFLSHPSISHTPLISYCHLFSFSFPTYTSSPSYSTITLTGVIQQMSLCLRNNGTNLHGVISQKIIIFYLFFTIPYTFQLQTTKLHDSKSVKLHCYFIFLFFYFLVFWIPGLFGYIHKHTTEHTFIILSMHTVL